MQVFPSLLGIEWDVSKTPEFSTLVQRAVSGREVRISEMVYPLYTFKMRYALLRDQSNTAAPSSPYDELRKLVGFFLMHYGSAVAFLYTDPDDGTVTDMSFGTGDGSDTTFQLIRTYGTGGFTFAEPVQNLNGAPTAIKANGVTVNPANYSVGSTGIVTFTTPPTNGHVLTWSGSFYYRVRFEQDASEFSQFMKNLWENREVSFVGSPANKV